MSRYGSKALVKRVEILEAKDRNKEKKLSAIEQSIIIDDLTKETFPGSGRYFYTYEQIGDKNGVSASKVSRIAEKNNLSRRNLRTV